MLWVYLLCSELRRNKAYAQTHKSVFIVLAWVQNPLKPAGWEALTAAPTLEEMPFSQLARCALETLQDSFGDVLMSTDR